MQAKETLNLIEKLKNTALKIGFCETGMVEINSLEYSPIIRNLCVENVCRNYGTSWACPPAVGTLEQCKERCEQYEYMMLFSGKYVIEDSFDYEGMIAGMSVFKKQIERFDTEISNYLGSYMLLSNESCGRCKSCTYPDEPCRFPEKLYHSIEGYGFTVNQLAMQAGIKYNNGENTITYFGALLFCNRTEACM